MELPVPPPGVNPYPFYRSIFRPSYNPSPGFQARLIVLSIFTASLPVLALLLFGLHVLKARRQGEKVFLFRRVRRPAGSYIVGARTPLLCLGVFVLSVPIGGALRAGWRYATGITLDAFAFNAFMNSYWILTFIAGWTYSCAGFQTYLLVDGERRFNLSPFVANSILLGGLFVGGGGTLGLALYARTLNLRFFNATRELFAVLEELGRTYDGTFDPAALVEIAPLAQSYVEGATNYFTHFPPLLYIFAACPLPVMLLNVSAILLWLILRRQGRENLGMAAPSAPGGDTESSRESDACRSTAQRRKEMKAIEHGFLVDAVAVFLWSSSVFATSIWTATIFRASQRTSWSRIEACLFLPAWSASIPLALAMFIQVILAWQGLPPAGLSSSTSAEGSYGAPRGPLPLPREEEMECDVHQVVFREGGEEQASRRERLEEKERKKEG